MNWKKLVLMRYLLSLWLTEQRYYCNGDGSIRQIGNL